MKKTVFITKIVLAFILLLMLNSWKSFSEEKKTDEVKANPPNVLIIMADDCTFKDLPIYGGKNVKTPNIDKLASQSMVFDKAYVSMSMCTPSRSELFTGLYPMRSGVAFNHSKAKPGTKSVVQQLGKLGYRTGIAGKIHVGPEDVFAFEKVEGIERNCVSLTANYDSAGMLDFVTKDPGPFCLLATLVVPHEPWTVGDYKHFDLDKLILPPYMADTPDTRLCYAKYLAEIEVLDIQVGKTLDMLEKSGKLKNTIVIFTSEQGSQFPFNKWTNWDMGLHTGFMVRWPNNVKSGIRTDALIQYADVLPTLVDAANGTFDDGEFDGKSFLKVLTGEKTTHRDFAYAMHNNIPEGPEYPIRSITDGKHRYIRNLKNETFYIEKHLMGAMPENQYWPSWIFESGNNQKTFSLINRYMNRPEEEFYNTAEDEYELNNLAKNTNYLEIKSKLSKELDKWMTQQNDLGAVIDTWEVFNNSK
tara:strand:+ start:28965 stop:30383 length:1419 start_codon:yes stop_codon:yes gene_type:complete